MIFYIDTDKAGDVNIAYKKSGIIYKYGMYTSGYFFKEIFAYLKRDVGRRIAIGFPIHYLNPFVNLLLIHLNTKSVIDIEIKINIINYDSSDRVCFCEDYRSELEALVNNINNLFEVIRNDANSQQFKDIIKNQQRQINKNSKSLNKYLDDLHDNYSSLLVLRFNFGYKRYDGNKFDGKKYIPELKNEHIPKLYSQAKLDFEHMFNNARKNDIFEPMVGFVWKLEFGLIKGFHYHLLLFFDGSQVCEDVTIARMIGEYWNTTITNGRGVYHNYNAFKDNYKELGIGMINHSDTEKRENLKRTALYLTKANYYSKIISIGNKIKTFGKGRINETPYEAK